MNIKPKSFNVLLAVVTILLLLIIVPLVESFMIRVKIADNLSVMSQIRIEANKYYNQYKKLPGLNDNFMGFPQGKTHVDWGEITGLSWYSDKSQRKMWIGLTFSERSGLDLNRTLHMVIINKDQRLKFYCGRWDESAVSIIFLPPKCQMDELSNLVKD